VEGFATNPFPPFDYSNISGRLVAYSFKKIVCIYDSKLPYVKVRHSYENLFAAESISAFQD
jgi:hypothetical protein